MKLSTSMKLTTIALLLCAVTLSVGLNACDGKGKEKPAANQGSPANGGTQGNADAGTPKAGDITLEPGQNTALQFSHLRMQFGPVVSGDTVKADYPFKNVTNTPIKITQAITSCPCMMTDFPKHQLQPGEVGTVKVRFATAGQMGRHEKIISVVMEGNNMPITLHLDGQINAKP